MPSVAILIDFGSTFTKVLAVDLERVEVLGRSQASSTVDSDVREGLVEALKKLPLGRIFDRPPKDLDALDGKIVFASSSAAGGLRIGVVGHVPGLTVEAASQAALGAGAKIVGSTSFKLNDAKLFELQNLRADIILLTGGVDGGDRGTILHNARVLADSRVSVPIIVGGNFAAAPEVAGTLRRGGKEARVVANVMPRAGELAATTVSFVTGAGSAAPVRTLRALELGAVWPGVEVELRADRNNVEKLFTLGPRAAVGSIAIEMRHPL